MRLVFLIIVFSLSNPVLASQSVVGEFSTVVGSECISEIHFFKNGRGVFIDYCGGEDDGVNKHDISWHIDNNIVHATINGLDEVFLFQTRLPCSYIGKSGHSGGLIGMDLYFWKKPVNCE